MEMREIMGVSSYCRKRIGFDNNRCNLMRLLSLKYSGTESILVVAKVTSQSSPSTRAAARGPERNLPMPVGRGESNSLASTSMRFRELTIGYGLPRINAGN